MNTQNEKDNPMRSTIIAFIVVAAGSIPLYAQHDHVGHSHYADEKQSHIPSITMDEFEEIQAGGGVGLAKPAELNHYPGPKHVLQLADSLGISEDQRAKIEAIRQNMADKAAKLGMEYLHAEHELNELFSNEKATEKNVVEMTRKVEEKRAALRLAHLLAHVETRSLLTPEQVKRYDELRGYVSN
ncbi:MAG: Spy/CpxP family protein refolding chaperone [Rhodothermales bacterium]